MLSLVLGIHGDRYVLSIYTHTLSLASGNNMEDYSMSHFGNARFTFLNGSDQRKVFPLCWHHTTSTMQVYIPTHTFQFPTDIYEFGIVISRVLI